MTSRPGDERTLERPAEQPRSHAKHLLAGGLFWLAVILILYLYLIVWPARFAAGQMVPYTILAPIDYSYVDDEKLSRLTGELSRDEVYRTVDADFAVQAARRLDAFAVDVAALSSSDLNSPRAQTQVEQLTEQYGVDPKTIVAFAQYDRARLDEVVSRAKVELHQAMSNPVTSALVTDMKEEAAPLLPTEPERIYAYFMLPNLKVTVDPRELYSERATVRVLKGQVIVAEGGTATPNVLKQLALVEEQFSEGAFYQLAGAALLLLGGMLLWWQYLRHSAPRALLRLGALVQFGGLFLLFLLLGLFIARLPFSFIPYAVAFAVTALACIVVLVYDTTFGAYFGIGLAVLLAVALNYEADLLIYLLGGALFPSVTITAYSRRRLQVLFALVMGVLNAALAGTIMLLSLQPYSPDALVIAGISGFAATVFALGLVPVIETFTSQLTPGKLIELANPENELLRRLKRDAHGTFSHSQMVADLVEEGCKVIGANWMMARVGALYHDIGKLKRPGFFAENIHDLSKNPHLGLPPESSAKILKDHVADGLKMAKEAHLPRELHRFIAEHHGTYLIKYFFHAASQQAQQTGTAAPEEARFHYPGPIPQSRESGVLMLADVTEAVTRATGEMEAEDLDALLDRIVSEKVAEGQLTDSQLTIGDLEKLKAAFHRVVMGSMHHRVRYPHELATALQFHYVDQTAAAVEHY